MSTYPTMMGLINETSDQQRRFGVGHFDLIIVDEAHRSIYQKYRAIFSYFDAFLVGLTATPKDEIDRNTYSLFDLENGVPTDAYGLDDAIAEGYLVPPRAVSVPLKFQREGIKYSELTPDEKDQWETLDWDEEGGVPDEVNADAVNKWLFNTDTVDKVLENLMTRGHKVAGGDRLGKTIVFAKNNDHAEFIAERFNANYPHYAGAVRAGDHVQDRVRANPDRRLLRQGQGTAYRRFGRHAGHRHRRARGAEPGVLQDRALQDQVLADGGTRHAAVQRPVRPRAGQEDFLIFDFCQNLEYFSQDLPATEGAVGQPLGQRLFNARLELIGELDKRFAAGGAVAGDTPMPDNIRLTEAGIRRDTAGMLHALVAGMSLDNFVVRPKRQWIETWVDAAAWNRLGPDQLQEIGEHLSGLPTAVRDDDEEAKRFDLLMLRLQLCALRAEPGFERLQQQVREIADRLSELGSIPAVREQMLLIDAIAGEEWWKDVTIPMLEQARRHLRALVKLLDKSARKIVYTDFEDELGESTEVELAVGGSAGDFERFRVKARAFLRAHEDHIALHKLRRNQALTRSDLAELERMLAESGVGTVQDIAAGQAGGAGPGPVYPLAGGAGPPGSDRGTGCVPRGQDTGQQPDRVRQPGGEPPDGTRRDEARVAVRIAVHGVCASGARQVVFIGAGGRAFQSAGAGQGDSHGRLKSYSLRKGKRKTEDGDHGAPCSATRSA